MKRIVQRLTLLGFALTLILAAAQHKPKLTPPARATVPPDSKIFVDSNNGFDTFLLAALQEKKVRLQLVSTADKADYILEGDVFHTNEFVATRTVASTGRTSEAAVKLTSKAGDIVWAYAVSKGILSRGKQSVAEACAKHLKEIVR